MATWNINVEAVEGPATSTTGNIPQWADASGDELTDGIGTSTGGNESADGGKAVIFKPSGQVHGSCGMVAGVYGTSSGAGAGVRGESTVGYGGYFKGNSAGGAIRVDQETTGQDIATFENSADGTNMVIGADGTLTWSDAAGSAGTTANLDAMVGDSGSGGTKGLVPAPAAGDAAAGKFLKADGTWATAGGGSGTVTSVAVSGSDGIEVDSGSPITGSGTIALGVNAASLRTHINVEDGADVTDEANVVSALDGATLTAATVASGDKVLVQDVDDSDNLKTVTAQSIADLASGGVSDGDKGDITVSGSGATWTIDDDVVSNAKAANMANKTIKGRFTPGTGDPEDLDANDVSDILDTATDPFARTSDMNTAIAAASGMVDQIDFESVEPGDDTITLRLYAHYAFTINELRIKTASGTCAVAVKIDGTDVTGISAVAVSSTEATGTATASNSVSVGQTVTLVISDSSSVANLVGSLKFTR